MMTRATATTPATAVVASIRCEKNIFPCELTYAHSPYSIPNHDCACRIDRQRMYAIAEQCGAYESRPTNEDKVRQG